MADRTHIQWTDATWSVVTGCTRVSEGCDHCYIERTPPFRMAHRRFDKPGVGGTTGVKRHSERLHWPLRWRKPRRIFVCSMADLFHDHVPDRFIAEVWAVMALAPQHVFQVLTKRPARMRALLSSAAFWHDVANIGRQRHIGSQQDWLRAGAMLSGQPLPNVWGGVSVENQRWADNRIPLLVETPLAVRFLSCEPLLGPIDLREPFDWLAGHGPDCICLGCFNVSRGAVDQPVWWGQKRVIDWVIAGGESGPGARPMHPDWARSLRDQCGKAGVAFFLKQWGEWAPLGPLYTQNDDEDEAENARIEAAHLEVAEKREVIQLERSGHIVHGHQPGDDRTWLMARLGKKTAGRELDGQTWDQYPAVVANV